LLRRIAEVAEEYGIDVIYVDERGTSSRCPLHRDSCGIRVYRGLFKCTTMDKVFNADIAAARNILMTATSNNTSMTPVTPESRRGIGGNGRRPGQGLNPQKKRGCSPNLPTQVGEGVLSCFTGDDSDDYGSPERSMKLLRNIVWRSDAVCIV